MLAIDLTGKHAVVAGVGDDRGFGFSIAKALAECGATISIATWPPLLKMFKLSLEKGRLDEALTLRDGSKMQFQAIYPFDADFDRFDDVPTDMREHRRYRELGDFTIGGLATALAPIGVDIVVHSLANAPEVTHSLTRTSRAGYLSAISTSAFSHVSLVQQLGPIMRAGGSFVTLSYLAGQRVVGGYGGGMSAAKAILESDARVLAYEAGRKWGHRVNVISPGPYASRAAKAIGPVEHIIEYVRRAAPLQTPITADEVGATAAFLSSPLASGITGTVVYVDKGFHAMGVHGVGADVVS